MQAAVELKDYVIEGVPVIARCDLSRTLDNLTIKLGKLKTQPEAITNL